MSSIENPEDFQAEALEALANGQTDRAQVLALLAIEQQLGKIYLSA